MTDLEGSFVSNTDSLAAHYAKPTERLLKKRLDHVNAVGRAFIAASPFLVLATGSREGLDCSPKGDRAGFVEVADDGRTLLIPDRRGANGGRMVGRRAANIDLPAPGGPIMSKLWPPLEATSATATWRITGSAAEASRGLSEVSLMRFTIGVSLVLAGPTCKTPTGYAVAATELALLEQ